MFPTKEDVMAHVIADLTLDCGYINEAQRKDFIHHCIDIGLIKRIDQANPFVYVALQNFSYDCMGKKQAVRLMFKSKQKITLDRQLRMMSIYSLGI